MTLPRLLPDWPTRFRWRRNRKADPRPEAVRVPEPEATWHHFEPEIRAVVRLASADPAGDLERERWG